MTRRPTREPCLWWAVALRTVRSGRASGYYHRPARVRRVRHEGYQGARRRINNIAFSPDGKLLVSGGIDGTVRPVWDTHTGDGNVLVPVPKGRQHHWEGVA